MNTKDSVSSVDHFAPAAGLLRWAEAQPGRRYENQAVIYHSGEDAGQFYCLIDGKVQIYMTSPEGIEKTITVYQNHALFGEAAFFDGSPRTTSARALVASRVVVIDRESILTCFREQPDLALSMICSLSRNVRMLSTQINEISFLPAEQRLARFLVEESGYGVRQVSYTHEEIGSMIGSSRVTVSRILRTFAEQRLICTSYRKIEVLQPKQLSRLLH